MTKKIYFTDIVPGLCNIKPTEYEKMSYITPDDFIVRTKLVHIGNLSKICGHVCRSISDTTDPMCGLIT